MSAPSGSGSCRKLPPTMLRAVPETVGRKAFACPIGNRRQIEEHQAQMGCPPSSTDEERAVATAHIEQAAMTVQRTGVQDLVGHQRLRSRHQVAVGGNALRSEIARCWRRRTASAGQRRLASVAGAALSSRDRIGQVCIQRAVMFDHRGHGRCCADHRRAQLTQPVTALRPQLGQAQRDRRIEQAQRRLRRRLEPHRQLLRRLRPPARMLNIETHTGQQDLRIDEAGDQVEELAAWRRATGRVSANAAAFAETSGWPAAGRARSASA